MDNIFTIYQSKLLVMTKSRSAVMALRNTVVVGGGLVGSAVACAIGAINGGAGCGRVTLLDHATSAIPAPKLTHFRCD